MQAEQSEISDFLSRYSITQRDSETTVVQSRNTVYLAKHIQVDSTQTDIDNVHETLEQHQTLSQNYLLTLLNYSITAVPNSTLFTVRTLYQYAHLTLREEISNRKIESTYFKEEEIWTIIFSVVKSLEYLQKFNIGYGVLGCDKIFIDKRIKLLDPSAVAEDPLTLAPHKLYSPQVINQHSSINILKSDVFVLGLCLLEAILLIEISSSSVPRYDQTKLNLYLQQVENLYNPELANLIRQMLQYCPEDRPSFSDIQDYLENSLDMAEEPDDHFNPLPPDTEDKQNEVESFDDLYEEEVCDIEEEEDRNSSIVSLNEYEKAKIRFITENNFLKEFSPSSEERSRYSQSALIETTNNDMGKRKPSKYIKDRLVKKIDALDLQVVQVKDYKRAIDLSKLHNQSFQNNLFTNPKLLQEIQKELKNIATTRSQMASKENFYSCNF